MRAGLITVEDRRGNFAADKLAVEGSDKHPSTIALKARAEERVQYAMRIQRKMLDIALAREGELRRRIEAEEQQRAIVEAPPVALGIFARSENRRGRKRRRPLA